MDDALIRLKDLYISAEQDSFCLFLGAGVNLPIHDEDIYYPAYSWPGLMKKIYQRNACQYEEPFEAIKERCGNDWPALAQALVGHLTTEEQVTRIEDIIYEGFSRTDKWSRLPIRMLRQAPSLHASICFSARILNRIEKGSWRFERNPKIAAVITTNYDFFFGAGWTCYQAFRKYWKPQTPSPSGKHSLKDQQKPIHYVHGYIPYSLKRKEKLALTRDDYKSYYDYQEYTRDTLDHALNHYNLIFLGFSFEDSYICNILGNRPQGGPEHFTIGNDKVTGLARSYGITAINIKDNYSLVESHLRDIYCAALTPDMWTQFEGLDNAQDYWKRLRTGPRGIA